jgi:hypothetical protein
MFDQYRKSKGTSLLKIMNSFNLKKELQRAGIDIRFLLHTKTTTTTDIIWENRMENIVLGEDK